jgi:hypothetical protein
VKGGRRLSIGSKACGVTCIACFWDAYFETPTVQKVTQHITAGNLFDHLEKKKSQTMQRSNIHIQNSEYAKIE